MDMLKKLIIVFVVLFGTVNCIYNGISAGNSYKNGDKTFIENNGEFPYMATLQVQGRHACGAAIIRRDFVLTAAHCLHEVKLSTVLIRAGSYWKLAPDKTLQESTVATVEYHPRVDTRDYIMDIVLIKLSKPFKLSVYVKVISMPKPKFAKKFSNIAALILGYGRVHETKRSDFLRKGNVKILSTKDCKRKIGFIDNQQICSIGLGSITAALDGDSGGPLIKRSKGNEDLLIGIISSAMKSDITGIINPAWPTTFIEIAAVREWIDGALKKLS